MVLLVGMLYWSRETEAAESRRLQEMAKKTEDSDKTNAGTKVETEKSEEVKEEPESVPEEEEKNPEGIVCWGDDLINGEASAKYSYKVVLQKLLEENGYTLPVRKSSRSQSCSDRNRNQRSDRRTDRKNRYQLYSCDLYGILWRLEP